MARQCEAPGSQLVTALLEAAVWLNVRVSGGGPGCLVQGQGQADDGVTREREEESLQTPSLLTSAPGARRGADHHHVMRTQNVEQREQRRAELRGPGTNPVTVT